MTTPAGTAGIDTNSQEWQMACLARHICRLPGRSARLNFMDVLRAKHPAEFVQSVENNVRTEWALMREKQEQERATNVNA